MKRNMLSILILALLIVNVVLTSVMMFTMMSTTKKTNRLIDGISSALSLEIAAPDETATTEGTAEVAMEDIKIYQIADQMTIGLAKGADGKSHYCMMSVSLSLNSKDPDYEKYNATLGDNQDMIKDKIFQIVGSHSIEEAESNQDGLREEILEAIQQMYGSKFVYNVVFRDIIFQ